MTLWNIPRHMSLVKGGQAPSRSVSQHCKGRRYNYTMVADLVVRLLLAVTARALVHILFFFSWRVSNKLFLVEVGARHKNLPSIFSSPPFFLVLVLPNTHAASFPFGKGGGGTSHCLLTTENVSGPFDGTSRGRIFNHRQLVDPSANCLVFSSSSVLVGLQ